MQHVDAVGLADRRQAVRAHEAGDGKVRHALHHLRLAIVVEPVGGLVQKQHARIAHQRRGQHDPLYLPAGEDRRAVAGDRLHLHRHGGDVLVDGGQAGGPPRVFLGEVAGQSDDVVEHGTGPYRRILHHHADPAAHLAGIEARQVTPVVVDGARQRLLQPEREPEQGALAGARFPHDGHELAGAGVDRDVLEDRGAVLDVAEVYVFDADVAAQLRRRFAFGDGSRHRLQDGSHLLV